jgi:ribonuclease G
MAKNLLVINVDIRETRVALIENGIIVELHIERESSNGTLGNIYLGKVSRVLPGMQAAFIDVGLERAAFLHVEDLIRPDDFEAYLAGRGPATSDDDRGAGARGRAPTVAAAEAEADDDDASIELPTAIDVESDLSSDEAIATEEDDASVEDATANVFAGDSGAPDAADEPEAAAADDDERDDDDGWGDGGDDAPAAAGEGSDDWPAAEADPGAAGDPAEALAADDADEAGGEGKGEAEAEGAEATAADAPTSESEEPSETGESVEGGEAGETGEAAAAPEGAEARVGGEEEGGGRGGRRRRSRRDARVRRSVRTRDRKPGQGGQQPDPAAAAPQPEPATRSPQEGRRGRGREGRQGRDGGRDGGRDAARGAERRSRAHEPPRVSKTTPIREVIREGQEVIVQISKEPIGTKGARVTSHVSLPGRYVVYLPTVDHIGISKRIGSEKERARLRESIESMMPPKGGLIVRTVAEGLTKKQLKADVGYLVRLWGEIAKKREGAQRAPACLYTELDLVTRTARDLFTDDIEKIVIDDREEYGRIKRFVETFMPERADQVELYEGQEPIFDAYGIEDEIGRALSRKVPLASGGHLIIDQAEALTAIDVNTGRFVGRGSRDLEETILTTNLEAVEEIAYQLRFRNIGGLIILDLIDMERAQNREKVRRKLEQLLAKDKAKTTLNRISELGLIEMTRKRTRESLGRMIHEPCFYCDGTGQLQSKQTVAYEIMRQIKRERLNLRGYVIVVNAHPAVIDLLKNEERIAVTDAERRFQRRIELIPRKEYHLEQFDLQGK